MDGAFCSEVSLETKTCSKCGCQKSITEFPSKGYWCKQCKNEYLIEWRRKHPDKYKKCLNEYKNNRIKWKKEHREDYLKHSREYSRIRRAKHPEYDHEYKINHRDKYREYSKKWLLSHPEAHEKKKEYNRGWNKKHPDKCKEALHKWRKEHPDYRFKYLQTPQGKLACANQNHKRRDRTKSGKFTLAEWNNIKQQQGFRCYWCK